MTRSSTCAATPAGERVRPELRKNEGGAGLFEVVTTLLLVGTGVLFGIFLHRYGGDYQSRLRSPEFAPEKSMSLVEFELLDSEGRTTRRSDFEGKMLVVNFVFTSCGATCFQVSRRMAELQGRLAGRNEVRLVSITIDPRTDRPKTLAGFANRLGAVTSQWTFLTGEPAEVERLLDSSFLPGFAGAKRDPYLGILDATRIAVVDRQGRLRGFFDGLKTNVPDAIERVVNGILEE